VLYLLATNAVLKLPRFASPIGQSMTKHVNSKKNYAWQTLIWSTQDQVQAREKLRGVRHFRSHGWYGETLEVIAGFQNFMGAAAPGSYNIAPPLLKTTQIFALQHFLLPVMTSIDCFFILQLQKIWMTKYQSIFSYVIWRHIQFSSQKTFLPLWLMYSYFQLER